MTCRYEAIVGSATKVTKIMEAFGFLPKIRGGGKTDDNNRTTFTVVLVEYDRSSAYVERANGRTGNKTPHLDASRRWDPEKRDDWLQTQPTTAPLLFSLF